MSNFTILAVLQKLLAQPREQETLEFKSNWNHPDDIGEYISALANAAALDGHERAWLIWGVDDATREVTGTMFDPLNQKVKSTKGSGNQAMVMWLQHLTQPRADFHFHEVSHPDGRVVLLEIHSARSAPVAFKNVRYIRIDSHKVKLAEHPDKEARLWAQLGLKEDWTGEVVPGATWDDLDIEALAAARLRYTEFRIQGEPDARRHDAIRNEVAHLSIETLLNKAHITKQGRITRSALLLLGKDESAHLLSPVDAKIHWIARGVNSTSSPSYPFGMPFLLATDQVYGRIRNDTVYHMPDGTLFPTPVQQYDPWVVREALHNCVAHQDYLLGGKINVVEHPDRLVFTNQGEFIPQSVEWMLEHQSPPEHYRNQWLIDGMIRLRMIEQAGSGIRRMFETQRERFFPLPDYAFDASPQGHRRVELTLAGRIMDAKFTRALMTRTELSLQHVLLLDKVQKGQTLAVNEVKVLRELGLIEGRAPKLFVSAKVADAAGQKARYIHNRGLDDQHYQQLVVGYLRKYKQAKRADFNELLMSKLAAVLTPDQKINKVRNLLQAMRRAGIIDSVGPRAAAVWFLSKRAKNQIDF